MSVSDEHKIIDWHIENRFLTIYIYYICCLIVSARTTLCSVMLSECISHADWVRTEVCDEPINCVIPQQRVDIIAKSAPPPPFLRQHKAFSSCWHVVYDLAHTELLYINVLFGEKGWSGWIWPRNNVSSCYRCVCALLIGFAFVHIFTPLSGLQS